MNKLRRVRWPLLLALLLGVGTWWGIGWWLSSRAYWEAWYEPIDGKRVGRVARILDCDDRYLYVETNAGTDVRYDIIDLHAKKRVVSHAVNNTALRDQIHPASNFSNPLGVLAVANYHFARTNGEIDYTKYQGCDLWLWNLLTNESQHVQTYP